MGNVHQENAQLLSQLSRFCDKLMEKNGRTFKQEVLAEYLRQSEIQTFVKFMYDPYGTFGVSGDKVYDFPPATAAERPLFTLFTQWKTRSLTGHIALAVGKAVLMAHPEHQTLLMRIFDRDLKVGVDASTINAVCPGLVPVFDVALAHEINKSPTYWKRVAEEPYLITRKLDGVRLITRVENGVISFRSRTGIPFTGLDKLAEALAGALPGGFSGVLDGELCVLNPDGSEDFKAASSQIRRKNFIMPNPHLKVFDRLTLPEFDGLAVSARYSERIIAACQELGDLGGAGSVIKAVAYSEQNLCRAQQLVAERGWEGLILRADKPYQSGRTSDLLKVKKFKDAEYRVEDVILTQKMMLGLDGVKRAISCAGSLVIRHRGNPVEVGSGMTDVQRVCYGKQPELIIGKLITVKYFEESADKDGNPSLRFPIFKGIREE